MSMRWAFQSLFTIFTLLTCATQKLSNQHPIAKLLTKGLDDENVDIDFVAVFLMTGLRGATALGAKPYKYGGEERDYFERTVSSRHTWAHRVRHFYAVVGKETESQVLNSKACKKVTHYNQTNLREEQYRCNDIPMLQFKQCLDTAWGSTVMNYHT